MIFRIIEQKLNKGGARYADPEILRTLKDYEAVDTEASTWARWKEKR